MSIFKGKKHSDGRRYIRKDELKRKFKEADRSIPGSRKSYGEKERESIEKDIFGNAGKFISEKEYKDTLERLEKQKHSTKSNKDRMEIDRKKNFLGKFLEEE